MICKIGTMEECNWLTAKIPLTVIKELQNCINILDGAYGKERNCYRVGGYVVFADTNYDVEEIKKTFIQNICEWSKTISKYLVELYLLGDDFAIVLCYPEILKENEVCEDENY